MMGVAGTQPRYKAGKDIRKILDSMAGITSRQRVEARLVYDTEGFRRYVVRRIHEELGISPTIINNEINKWVWHD